MADEHFHGVAPPECIGRPVNKDEGHGRLVNNKRQNQAGPTWRDGKKWRRGGIGRADFFQRDLLTFDDGLGHRHGRGDRHLRRDVGRRKAVVTIDAQLAAIDEQHGDMKVLRRRAVRERVQDPAQRRRLIETPDGGQDSPNCVAHPLIVQMANPFVIGYRLFAIALSYWLFAIGHPAPSRRQAATSNHE